MSDLRGTSRLVGKPAANVVVWLDAPDAPRTTASTIVLQQRNMAFSPRVLAAQVGTVVELPNYDRVFHNVFSFTDGKPFDLGLYPTGATKRITLDRPALSRLYCNIHPHMAAYIMAVASPYFAVSDQSGSFTIRSVPEGTYTYHAWRPGSQKLLSGTIAVEAGRAWRSYGPDASRHARRLLDRAPALCTLTRRRQRSSPSWMSRSAARPKASPPPGRKFVSLARGRRNGASLLKPRGQTCGDRSLTRSARPIPTTAGCSRWRSMPRRSRAPSASSPA